ncbi:fibrillin-2-like [Hydractinia symbiolongicarpus]|uniref:fibrillin-2-like n=1 Tax=Hydractinia symbiolongicarpus TaxID=13093 RepID=UPI00254EAD6F|nr:fibrillin-2-like [Hydractinia symbiolongicarpus]
MYYFFVALVFLCYTASLDGYNVLDVTNGLDKNGANVCSYPEQVSKQVSIKLEQTTLTKEIVRTCCRRWCFIKSCNRTILRTKKIFTYHLQTKYFDRRVYHCCNDWKRKDDSATECKKPICGSSCQNGGTCVSPDKCECRDGYEGKYCQLDKDECRDASTNKCEHHCINLRGGYKCGCKTGYVLNQDKQTCSDVDECKRINPPCGCAKEDGTCSSQCINVPGSYVCKCQKGYQLNSAQKCEDINECFSNSKLCDQQCINTPGSFRCGCAKGFKFNGKSCEDINECLTSNGGCSDKCHNLDGGYVCSCPDGFYLTKDRKTCKVIEPTMKSKVVCESDQIGTLDCANHDEKIIIIDAMYGRLSTQHCQQNNYTQNVRCKADNPIQHLQSCNNKAFCVFFIQKEVFGDPCPGIEKYMQVTYDCVYIERKDVTYINGHEKRYDTVNNSFGHSFVLFFNDVDTIPGGSASVFAQNVTRNVIMLVLLFGVFCFIHAHVTTSPVSDLRLQGHNEKPNVCIRQERFSRNVKESYLKQGVTSEIRRTCCDSLCWNKCRKTFYRTRTHVMERVVLKWFTRDVYECCKGWKKADDSQCTAPICENGCQHAGTCTGPNNCSCLKGYIGQYCQIDRNECLQSPCGCAKDDGICNATCMNTPGSFQCLCNRGYQLNGEGKCEDINECSLSPCGCAKDDGICNATCLNTPGSFQCSCNRGYQLNGEGKCEDINECLFSPCGCSKDDGICNATCSNTPGSFQCSCNRGYQLNDDGKCEDINECLLSPCGCAKDDGICNATCSNTPGSFQCSCNRGYQLNGEGKCEDINECLQSPCQCAKDDGICNATCVNNPGSFKCLCRKGYQLNTEGECQDINECIEGLHTCDQFCINTPGSYECLCRKGYRYNGNKCVDIDECFEDINICSHFCHNLQGEYTCTCPDGYYLSDDRKNCKPITNSMKQILFCTSDKTAHLSCANHDEKIIIIDAMYGRLSTQHCQQNNYTQNVRCKADNPIQHLLSCNNKAFCVFFIQKEVFGDPCPGIEKYMQVTYDCV